MPSHFIFSSFIYFFPFSSSILFAHFILLILLAPSFPLCKSQILLSLFLSIGNLDLTGPKQVFKAENNSWVTPIADQFQLGISHVFEYIRSETYK